MDKKGMDWPERSKAPENDVERPVSKAYSTIDTDLARDNLENDIPAADLEDL